jgi:PhnB protein
MSVTSLNPYLGFQGNAAKAIAFYEKALGAKVEGVMKWGEGPMQTPPEMKDRVMHAELAIGGGKIMLCDEPQPSSGESNINVCLHLNDNADMARKFDALAVGGQVIMPIADAFWGATFGMLKDAFGIKWMFVGPKR